MSGLIDKDDASWRDIIELKEKSALQGQRHSYFRIVIENVMPLTLLFFALTIITLMQIVMINYNQVKNTILFATAPLPFIEFNALFFTSHKRVFMIIKQKVEVHTFVSLSKRDVAWLN